MATTKDYLDQLTADKALLVQTLNAKGVTASDTETFTELVPKVDTISGGGNIGYQVTFKVDGNDYYVSQCLQGESITEPPTPTMQGGVFAAWQLNGVDVLFPYTPSADVELIARVEDITVTTAGTSLYTYSGGAVTKRLDGFAVYGYCTYNTTQKFLFLVSQTARNTEMSGNTMAGGGSVSFVYNGETWYYSHSNATVTTSVDHPAADVGDYFQYNSAALIAKAILDAYFNV